MWKKVQQALILGLVPPVAWVITRFIFWSLRKEFVGHEPGRADLQAGRRIIAAHFHSRALLTPRFYHWMGYRPIKALVSQSFDGRLAGGMLSWYDVQPVYGSSTRGGEEGLAEMIAAAQSGFNLVITPDGPRGPAEAVKPGGVKMAAATEAPIYPVTFFADRVTRLRSWDRFIIPHPFARAVFILGDAIRVPADATAEVLEAKRREVEAELKRIDAEAEKFFASGEKPNPAKPEPKKI